MTKRKTKQFKYTITCAFCGKVVGKNNRQETCSFECRTALKQKRFVERAEAGECPVCHETKVLPIKVYEHHVCSDECKTTLLGRYWRQRYGAGSDWQAENLDKKRLEKLLPPKEKVCLDCGKPLVGMKRRFCSPNCKRRYYNHTAAHQPSSLASKANIRKSIETEGECSMCGVSFADIPTPMDVGFRGFFGNAAFSKFHMDHIVPASDGGTDAPDNLRLVCWMCNHIRSTLDAKYDEAVKAASLCFWNNILGKV